METPPLERKLAAILAADFEGYSRLMHSDEEGTLATLTAHRTAVDNLIATAHGQIFGTAGDSVLAEFPSVVEAYQCAIAIQQTLFKANADLTPERRMSLRIGINLGDVMVKDGDIFGDGVNIAARVEGLAEPDGICITRGVRDQLRDKLDGTFDDLGEHAVKNIKRPVRVFKAAFNIHGAADLAEQISASPKPASEEITPESATEIAFWQSVQASDSETEYRLYLDRFPKGAFVELARARLEGDSSVEEPGVEQTYWETVRNSNDRAMVEAYLKKYPKGQFRALAEIALGKLGDVCS